MMNKLKSALVKLLAVSLLVQPFATVAVQAKTGDAVIANTTSGNEVSENKATVTTAANGKGVSVTTSVNGTSVFTVNAKVKVQLPGQFTVVSNNSGLENKKVAKISRKNVFTAKAVKNVASYQVELQSVDNANDKLLITVVTPSYAKDYKSVVLCSTSLDGSVSRNVAEMVCVELAGLVEGTNAANDVVITVNKTVAEVGKYVDVAAGKNIIAQVYNAGNGQLYVFSTYDNTKGSVKITANLYGAKYNTGVKITNKAKFSKKAIEARKKYVK